MSEGKVEEGSTDAITGAQLFEVDESVKGLNGTIKQVGENVTTLDGHINKYLAGGAKVLAGTEPTYKVQGKEHHDVGSAFVGVDTSLTDLYAKFDGLQNSVGDDSLVAQNKESKLITIGAKVEGNKISITNKSGQARTLTGLAEGSVRGGSTDAVTGAQLYGVQEKLDPLDLIVKKAEGDVTKLDKNINKYLAGGANVLTGTQLTYKVQDDEYHSVGAAFVGVDSKLTDLYDKLGKVETVGDDSLVAQGVSGVITIGAKVEGSKISITNKKGEARTLTGLAEGDLSEASTEAVTGKQLWDVQEKFEPLNGTVEKAKGDVETLNKNINEYLGGADVLAGKAPTYKIQGKEHHNVGTAFVGVDNTLTVLVGDVDYVMKAVNNSLVEQEGLKITIGAKVEGNEISIAGSAGLRTLTGLADGSETEESTDAVTGKQLYKFKGEVETLTSTVNEASGNVTKLAGNLNTALGGDANVLAGEAPTYKILGNNDEGYKGVEAAFKGVDGKLTELEGKIDGVTGTANNALVAQDKESKVITIGGKAEGDKISILNKDGGSRTLTGLSEGSVTEGSTDAITGAQLFEVDESVKGLNGTIKQVGEHVTTLDGNINKYLAGGANVLGSEAPTYEVQEREYNSVGAAFEGVDTSLTDLYEKFDGLQNSVGDDSLVAQNKESKLITIGAKVEGNKISITNKKGQARTLTGLAEGSVRGGSTDAVTGAQLYGVQEKLDPLDLIVKKAEGDVTKLDKNINKYLAGGANVLTGTQLTYKVQDDEYHSVGAAFVGVDSKLTDLYDKLGKVETVGDDSLVAQGVSGVITIGAKVEGSKISITNKKGEARTLTGLAEGDLSEASTEAVTGKQLWDVQEKFEPLNGTVEKAKGDVETLNKNINEYLGGADVLAGKAPTYKIQGKEHHNVGTAFVGVDNTLTVLVGDVDYVMKAVNNSLVEQEGLKITIGGKVGGNEISIAGSAGLRKLTGLAEGDVSDKSTEAVTGKQLYKFKGEVETLTSTVNEASGNVTTLAGNLNTALGGDANVLAGEAPTYKILGNNDEGYKGVEAAFKGVDGKLKELDEKIDGVTGTASNALVAQDKESKVITIGGKAEGDEISILNKDGGSRTLTGLSEGSVTEGSTDAITGAQLFEVEQKFEPLNGTIKQVGEHVTTLDGNINKYLAGGANVLGSEAPTYEVQEREYNSVGAAFEGVDTSLTDLYAKFDGLQNSVGDDSLVAQNKESKLITIGAKVEGNKISITNKSGQARTLTGLAEGSVRGGSTDAVTGAQLYGVQEKLDPLDLIVKKAEGDVTKLDENINKYLAGGANVLAGKAPTYKVQKDEYNSVGSAFEGVDSKLTDLYDKLGKVETVGDDSLVAQGVSGVITIGAKVEGSKISITNKKGEARTLTGLAEGDLSEVSTEAVTGKQLWEVQEKFKPLNSTVEEAKGDVETLNKNINKYLGGADVLAGKEPTYTIQGSPYNNVGTAFVAVDNTLTQLSNQIDEIETNGIFVRAGGGSLIEQDPSSHIITIGAKVGGDEISIANKDGGERKLTGLKEGKVDKNSTEAVTGKQLFEVEQKFEPLNGTIEQVGKNVTTLDGHINKYLAGGANVLAGTEPTYKVQGKEHHDVGSAFVGVDTSLTDLYAKFDGLQNSVGDDSLVAQNKESKLITIGAKVEGNKISITNKSGQARTLTGLAEGSVTGGSTDAVTGAQLYGVQEKLDPLDLIVKKAEGDVTKLDENINEYLAGGANVLAGKAPTYKVQKDEYNSVEAAFKGVDSKLTDLYDKLGKVETVGDDSLVAQGVSGVITIGAKVEGSKISITNKKGEARTLTGLAEGDLSEASTEAVTGKQLWEVQEKFEPLNGTVEKAKGDVETLNKNINEYLGGADVLAGKEPTYTIQGSPYNNVGTAFVAVDNTLTQLSNQIDEIETNGIFVRAGGGSLIEQDPSSHIITIGAKVGGDEISIANKDGGERKLTGLKEGKVDKNSTEAITGKQLFEMNTTIAEYFGGGAGYQDGKWTDPTFTIADFGVQSKNGEQTYHNVADAFGAVNSSMSGLNGRIEKVEQQTSSQVNSDSLNWNNDKNAYDASHDGKDSKITHVAQGDVEQGSTDAVTGHQLWVIDEKINNLEGKVDSIVSEVDIITDGAVVYDKDEQGNKINSITLKGGKEDEPVLIDNVADGKIEKDSKQAVNGGQLHNYVQEQTKLVLADANKYTDEKIENIVGDAVAQANAYTDMKFSALSYKIDSVQKEARQAAAIGLSVSNLRYNDTPGKFSVAFGSGMWRNHSAPAFGAGYTSEDGDIRSNLSVTTSGGHWGVGAGISFTLN
ncbi:Vomp family autotransporter [Bartonella schoenbuchensis]|uniref:YadA-like C-terminal region n=1 Tax=Bartonella schoenbuchensis (strain DSM 13525 / NCTC 13165 / R1) TaxID=687861 RepID=A0A1S6XPE8_BARSR|nr:Vomp family autotransporter [Bartonella schoenbuchensis]AQX30243.1 YadA-like C-terminal region [Bartonella schoenbuchensis R1]